jgi:hypothetical protein
MRNVLALASKSFAELVALAVVASVLLAPSSAHAETRPPPEVSIVIAAEARAADDLELVVRELLARLAVAVQVTETARIDVHEVASPLPSAGPLLARVWIDFKKPGKATLYLLSITQDRLLVRTVERAPTGDELAREELGHILETAIEGLLSGANVGLPRADVIPLLEPAEPKPAPPLPPPPAPKPETVRWWQVGALYEVSALSSQVRFTHGPMLSLLFRAPLRPATVGLWLTGQYRLPVDLATSPAGATFHAVALRGLVTLDSALSKGFVLRTGIGGGADIVQMQPMAIAGYVPATSQVLSYGVLRASAGIEARAAPSLILWFNVAGDLDPSGASYVVEPRAGEKVVLRPWIVRPAVALGAAFP